MRHGLLLAAGLLLLSTAPVLSRIVYPDEAEVAAKWRLQQEGQSAWLRLSGESHSIRNTSRLYHRGRSVGFLVELEPGGFMIISGITELAPVKFIAYQGDFASFREHPLYQDIVEHLSATMDHLGYSGPGNRRAPVLPPTDDPGLDEQQLERNEELWEIPYFGKRSGFPQELNAVTQSVPPLLTTRWDQGTPYNQYTPRINNQATYTGCSATSQAQIMYFWKYPASGRGSHSYTWSGQTLSANFNHTYNWSSMVNSYTGAESTAQKDAIARLMSDVGISINMNYGTGGSGAVPNYNNSLCSFFNYSPDVKTIFRSSYANVTAWFAVFKDQVDKGWPASLAIFSAGGGHSVVVDGYRTDNGNQVHINMGWSGFYDNYYALDGILNFTDPYQYAVINIHPPGTTPPPVPVLNGNRLDFNSDNQTDILWRHYGLGQNAVWLMNGTAQASAVYLPLNKDLNWKIAGAGDFNGDNKTDILWRHYKTGQNMIWLMNGTALLQTVNLTTITDQRWKIAGTGDFNGDNKIDILWRHYGLGQNLVWLMNGTVLQNTVYLPVLTDLNWKIAGTGDFNGDGKLDIYWWHATTGQSGAWLMNGTTYLQFSAGPTVTDKKWRVVATGDFNNDGKCDLICRHFSNGQNRLGLMDGTTLVQYVTLLTINDQRWQINSQ